ncbi:MAG: AsmA family protein [Woeseiaceae bacterium]|nr:AsmA family protein [Woeseiaceae bacterium]
MRRILFWSSLLLLTLVAALAIWLWTADLGLLKPQVERWVTEKTGRDFRIDGRFSVDLAERSIVIAEGVHFGNADWADAPHMVRIGRAEVHLRLMSLLRGPVVVDLIDVDDADVQLQGRDDDSPNWDLGLARSTAAPAREVAAGPPVLLKKIDVDRASIILDSPNRSRLLSLDIASLDQLRRDDDNLELSLEATLNDSPVRLNGELGTWENLLAGTDVQYDIEGRLDTFEFSSDGWIDYLARPRRPSLGFTAAGPDINDLLGAVGLAQQGEGDIDLSGSLRPTDDGTLTLQVKGNLGRMEIETAGSVSDLQNLEQVDLDLLVTAPDLSRLLGLFGVHQLREGPFMIDVEARRQGLSLVVDRARMVFAEAQFDLSANMPTFPGLDDSRIALSIAGPDIERFRYLTGLPGQATGPFAINFDVDVTPDGVELLHLDLETSLVRVEANGKLGDAPDYIGSELDLTVRSGDLASLGNAYGVRHLPARPMEIRGEAVVTEQGVRTRGPLVGTVNDVRVALDGTIAIERGLLGSNVDFEIAGPDLAALIGAFGVSEYIPDEPYDFDGQLQVDGDGYRFRGVTGTLGSSEIRVDGLLVPRHGIVGSRFDFSAGGPAFEEAMGAIGNLKVHPGQYTLAGSFSMHEDRFSFEKIELDRERGELRLDLDLGRPASRQWMNFDISGRGNDIRMLFAGNERFEVAKAAFAAHIEGRRDGSTWSFDTVDIGIGDVTVFAGGDLDFGEGVSRTKFRFTGNIPDLSAVGTVAGHRMRPQPISWNTVVRGGSGELHVEELGAKLGESDVNGEFHYVAGDTPEINLDLKSDSLLLVPLLEERQREYDPEPERSDGRLIPDIAIPFESMRRLNASVSIRVGELERDNLYLTNVHLDAELRDGVFKIPDVGFNARSGYLQGRATIEPGDPAGLVDVEMTARDFALGLSPSNVDLAMTGDIDLKLSGKGNDLRTVLGNANGVLMLETHGGRFSGNRFLSVLYGDLLDEILSAINPFYRSDRTTQFDCVVVPAKFVDGVMTGEPNSFIRTDKLRIATNSKVDLKTEELSVAVRTSPRRGIGISAAELLNPFVKITGTLARPKLAVDEQGVLITGGAAVATGGLSLLARGVWDRLNRSGDACALTSAEGRKLLGSQFPVFESPPAE